MNKLELVRSTQRDYDTLEALFARLTEEQMLQPGVEGDWSARDVAAHVGAWEGMMCGWLEAMLDGREPVVFAPGYPWSPDADDVVNRLNDRLHRDGQRLSPAEALARFRENHLRAVALIERFPEKDMLDPARYAWRRGLPLVNLIAGNTTWHYNDHIPALRAWVDARSAT